MKRTVKLIGAVILCALLFATLSLSALANSAVTTYGGIDGISPIVIDGNTPLCVEKELLTFDIETFPESWYRYPEQGADYGSSVTAEYTVYNPTDSDQTARLLFPFGAAPTYMETETVGEVLKNEKYGIELFGERVEGTVRHTYAPFFGYDDFNIEKELSKLSDDYIDDGFFSPSLTVTKYTYEVKEAKFGFDDLAEGTFNINDKSGDRMYFLPDHSWYFTNDDGSAELGAWVDELGQEIELFILGDPLADPLKWQFYLGEKKTGGRLELISTEKTTFEEFALKEWSENSGISRVDMFNAVVAEAKDSAASYEQNIISIRSYVYGLDDYSLLQWYDYRITVPAGERVVNSVCAPIFPLIDEGYTPPIYEYSYLLSPAETWKDFGELEIVINTPHYLVGKSSAAFSKTDGGYTAKLSGLPEKELVFALSSSPDPESPMEFFEDLFSADNLLLALPIIGVVGMLIGGIVIVIVAKSRNKEGKNK